jgi:hypothetical protein
VRSSDLQSCVSVEPQRGRAGLLEAAVSATASLLRD